MDTKILLENGTNELEILEFKIGDNSYGINVAKLAKLPDEVIARAKVILDSLQDNNMETKLEASSNTVIVEKESAAEKMLSQIDPMQLSPIDALSTLIELKKLL